MSTPTIPTATTSATAPTTAKLLDGKSVLTVAASRGIGAAAAHCFAAQ